MKILIRKNDRAVIYAQPDLYLTDTEAGGDGWRDFNFSTATAVIEDHDLPANYYAGCHMMVDGVWGVLPAQQAFVTASIAAQLASKKEAAWERIKHERDRRKFAGVKVGSDWFHCDLESRSQWERMANKAAKLGLAGTDPYTIGGQPVPWKTMTGTFVLLTAGKVFAVVDAIELQEAMVFGRAEQHRVAMEASDAPESYDISSGWPASIED